MTNLLALFLGRSRRLISVEIYKGTDAEGATLRALEACRNDEQVVAVEMWCGNQRLKTVNVNEDRTMPPPAAPRRPNHV